MLAMKSYSVAAHRVVKTQAISALLVQRLAALHTFGAPTSSGLRSSEAAEEELPEPKNSKLVEREGGESSQLMRGCGMG